MRLLCQNGHTWVARKSQPVKCRHCGTTTLFNIDVPEINPSAFAVQAVNAFGFTVVEARVHVREVVPIIGKFLEEQEGITIKVFPHAGNDLVTGRMGVAVPEGATVKGISLNRGKKPRTGKLVTGVGEIAVEHVFKHSVDITRYGKGKLTGDLPITAQKLVLDIHELSFTFLKRVEGLDKLTRQQQRMYRRKWLNPLKNRFTAAGGMILFIEVFPAIEK
ncbi:MAG: hypothetical protein ACFFD4_12010 [Candidatus Odinarchaeota archaeon]